VLKAGSSRLMTTSRGHYINTDLVLGIVRLHTDAIEPGGDGKIPSRRK